MIHWSVPLISKPSRPHFQSMLPRFTSTGLQDCQLTNKSNLEDRSTRSKL